MRVTETTLTGVKCIHPFVFKDHRGDYVETYNEQEYVNAGIEIKFIQDDISVSKKNVLRGLHGDEKTWKLVWCAFGELLLAVVNCDQTSPEYKKWETFVISDKNRMQVLIPPKFANGHLVLSDYGVFSYKQSTYYEANSQFTIRWDDPEVDVCWPEVDPILSQRDSAVTTFSF